MERAAAAGSFRSSSSAHHEIDAGGAVPAQFFYQPSVWQPEKRLLAAVLQSAIAESKNLIGSISGCATKEDSRRARDRCREAAQAWIRSTARVDLMDFEPLCEALGLEPSAVRRALVEQWV